MMMWANQKLPPNGGFGSSAVRVLAGPAVGDKVSLDHTMPTQRPSGFLMPVLLVGLAVCTGWLAYHSCAWLVYHDATYIRVDHSPFHLVCVLAEAVHFVGVVPMMIFSAVAGGFLALILRLRQRYIDEKADRETVV